MKTLSALLLAVALLPAQDPSSQSVVVTGVAEPLPLSEADRDITLLPLPPKQAPLFDAWFNLLQLDPALDLRQRSPGGFLADLSIRGAAFGQTLVLLNGMRLNDAQTGHFNLDLPLPLETISSLEVLKGSGSTLYGSDAIGGVVNVRTLLRPTPELRLLGALGNFGANQQHVLAAFGTPAASEQLALSRDFSSGFAPNRDYRNLALSSLSSFSARPGAASLLLAYSDRPFGADQFYGNYPSWERIKTWFASLHQNLGARTEANFAYRRHSDLFVLFRDRPQVYTNRHLLHTWQANLRRHDRLPHHGVLSYGLEGLGESIRSTNLGDRSRTRAAGYLFYDLRALRRFGFSAGLREELYLGRQLVTSPSLSANVWLSARLKARASLSHAFRLPSYTDLYYSDPANRGNPSLKAETAASYEAALEAYPATRIQASFTAFQRRESNGIDYVRADPSQPWQAANFDRLRFTGIEAAAAYDTGSGQRLSLAFAALTGSLLSPALLSTKYAFNYPVQSTVLDWRASLAGRLLLRTRLGAVHRLARDPYAIWDVSAAWSTGRLRPFLRCTNLTATVYQEIPGVLMPRRGILGGVELVLLGSRR